MLPRPGAPTTDDGALHFNEDRCCTYFPTLHNFLAGGVLADSAPETAAGRLILERMVAARAGITPLSVDAPAHYWTLYSTSSQLFGRKGSLRCPFLDAPTGRCGVWQHRESTCSTWFCKHERGAVGGAFWKALHQLLMAVEGAVALHCATELQVGSEALAALVTSRRQEPTGPELDGAVDHARHLRHWGHWLGREREFFVKSAPLAQALSWERALQLAGAEGTVLALQARKAFARLRDDAPLLVPLRLGRFKVRGSSAEAVQLVTYRDYDPLPVSPAVFAALGRFDGRETAVVVAEVAARGGPLLDAALVRRLVDHEILLPRAGPEEPNAPRGQR
jgi:Fe-S-cluster containining protein